MVGLYSSIAVLIMKISVPLENGLLPDRFGKYAPAKYKIEGHTIRSFPIKIEQVPKGAQSLALEFLDWDAIPVGGFCWIHWSACNIAPDTALIPENASAAQTLACVQGSNSNFSALAGRQKRREVVCRYSGPCPPDKTHIYTLTVYALDCMLDLDEGYYLNEFRRAIQNHVLDKASFEIPSRS